MREELIAYTNPKSPLAEMFKTLRTNIQFMTSREGQNSILITSTLPGEGKSWTAANLAVTFAQAGKRVIIVDADMRKGRQFNIFDVSPRLGLSNYLSGVTEQNINIDKDDLRQFIKTTEIELVDVMPAGDVPPNPSELLVSTRMEILIKRLKEIYDLVILDAPPSLLVTDAAILSRVVDNTLIVVSHKETKMDDLNKVKKDIEKVGGKIAGVVINKMPIKAKRYQYNYYGDERAISKETRTSAKIMNKTYESRNNEKEKANEKIVQVANEEIIPNKGVTPNKEAKVETEDILKEIQEYLEKEKQKI